MQIVGETAEPQAETPAFAFEESGVGEELGVELSGIPELPETPALSFEMEEAPVEAEAIAETIEEIPEFSFEPIDVQEEPEKSPQPPAEELDLGSPSFDFNLEGLTAQDIEMEDELKSVSPDMPVMPEVYDFEDIQQFQETAVEEEIIAPAPGRVETAEYAAFAGVTGIEGAVDGIMRRYFDDELPMLIEKSMENMLKQYGVIKTSTILVTGTLEDIGITAILKLVSDQEADR